MSLFRKRWRLVCKMRMKGEKDYLAYYSNDYWFYWLARFDAWWARMQARGSKNAVMTQIDNIPEELR